MVDRWRPILSLNTYEDHAAADMGFAVNGGYVKWEDYDRLSQKCAALAKLAYPVHPDPTGKTREPPHCPSCSCDQHPTDKPR